MDGIGSRVIGLVVAVILIVAVAIPVTNSVIASAALNGTTGTVVGYIPLFLAVGGLATVAFTILY